MSQKHKVMIRLKNKIEFKHAIQPSLSKDQSHILVLQIIVDIIQLV